MPTAFEPDYRWQCGTLKTPHEPCQPSSPQTVAHSHRVHEVTGSLLLLIHVCFSCCCFFFFFFCSSLCRLRFAHRRKGGKVNIELGHIELGPTSTTFPSQEGSLKVQSIQLSIGRSIILWGFFYLFFLSAFPCWLQVHDVWWLWRFWSTGQNTQMAWLKVWHRTKSSSLKAHSLREGGFRSDSRHVTLQVGRLAQLFLPFTPWKCSTCFCAMLSSARRLFWLL